MTSAANRELWCRAVCGSAMRCSKGRRADFVRRSREIGHPTVISLRSLKARGPRAWTTIAFL